MKNILVTGADGYIGRHVTAALCDMSASVIAVDLRVEGVDKRASAISYDIFSNHENIYEVLGCPDICVHLAWRDGFVHNSDAHMEDLLKHFTFLRAMMDGGIKQLAIMGTMHEIGYFEGAVDEHTPCNPINMYGIAKDALRRSVFLLAKEKDICLQWLRAYYIYGDDMRNNSVFSKIRAAAESGMETFPFVTGKNKYDFIKVEDLAKQIASAVMQTEISGVINCCSGNPISLVDKVNEFIQENGYSIRLNYGEYPDRPYDSPAIWGNPSKIQKIMEGYMNG